MRIKSDYPIEKIYITENGCAYNDAPNQENIIDDSKRIKYHSSHLKELKMQSMMEFHAMVILLGR
ncbi:MAG: hypothetical protein CM15mP127_15550 [Gammaproteobacteria bacterium]|nr:MAG: hypothetical protein CM15mP127_15550 [Gammaproteobacteria bacterium]